MDRLSTWLIETLKERGWSHSELARRSGVSQAAISGTISGDRKAGADFCVKVAGALGEAPEKVLRLAGILPSVSTDDPALDEAVELLKNLSTEQRRLALRFIRTLYQSAQDNG